MISPFGVDHGEVISKAKHLSPVPNEKPPFYLPKHSPGAVAARKAAANPKPLPIGPAIRAAFRPTRFGKRMSPGRTGRLQSIAEAHHGHPTAASRYANTRLLLAGMGKNAPRVQRDYAKNILDRLVNTK